MISDIVFKGVEKFLNILRIGKGDARTDPGGFGCVLLIFVCVGFMILPIILIEIGIEWFFKKLKI